MAVIKVPLLVLAGLVISNVWVGSVAALFETGHGQTLVVKTAGVAVLLRLAALNKFCFLLKMIGDVQAVGQLLRSISFEWLAMMVIFPASAGHTSVLTLPS